ncbi:MAG: CHASE2 domain-containing protein, partial [Candidatus Marinimicrobia bacterium]|nr:CHASE2 domain-containing protein [Candidatus Neomarinimicrobiota bacterium]
MSDFLKRIGIGGAIGLGVAILVGWGSYEVSFVKSLLDGYEFLSYDGRMRARTAGVEQMSIEDVVIVDIDNTSVAPPEEGGLGHYFDWPQAYHGRLINTVSSGNPAALLFDIIFDKENTFNYDLVNALTSENVPQREALSDVTNQYLATNDPSIFLEETYNSQKAYHALVFEEEDTLNFLYKMDAEPEGYYYENHIIHGISEEAKS